MVIHSCESFYYFLMIDHANKVIFIHIPRCAGTTIERMFLGTDFWYINPVMKHATASIYRKFYATFWDDYYKFAIVRDPYDRFRSMWKHSVEYKLKLNKNGEITLSDYIECFERRVVLEHQTNLEQNGLRVEYIDGQEYKKCCVYGNYLNEHLDDIFRFEDLSYCFSILADRFPKINHSIVKAEASDKIAPALSQQAIQDINRICHDDFLRFGYPML